MDITCPHCHQTLEGDSSLVGETVTCPGCNREFVVPKIVSIKSKQTVHHQARSTKKNHGVVWLAIGIPICLLMVLAGLWLTIGRTNSSSRLKIVPLQSKQEAFDYFLELVRDFRANGCPGYKDIMRFPDKYKGKELLVEGTVRKVSPRDHHRVDIELSDDDNYWLILFDDENTWKPDGNILKGDVIVVGGTFREVWEWTGKNALGIPIQGSTPVLQARIIVDENLADELAP